ncbi:hypothetical protein RHGRI_011517 [Rhododendron griersonianum]|uniref:Transposase n=1 Tax=Rhododendron griersonianum TaxID=479676 RepID=A0AAV6KN55_9ERIC|nr:hypothetical protein RHGRI_011517 [Rhododendron griersonianum]
MSAVEETNNSTNPCEQPIIDVLTEEPIGDPSLSPAEAEVCLSKEKGRKASSAVWDHFSKNYEKGCDKPKGATCNYCKNSYAWVNELPFKFVEREGFRYFCSVMQPNFKNVSRNTMARECVAIYANEKQKLRKMFKKSNLRVCLTTDTWTSLQNISYMCLTAHFIDNDWKLHKRIINFYVISSHKGEAIGKALEACLIEWGVEKLCTLTVDNATANDVAVAYLKKKFSKKGDTFILGGEYFHIRCCAHIINLIVKDGLGEIKDSIVRIRDAVKYVRSSPQREQRFKACVEKERITCKNSLCLDVPTRWNSTFLMLATAIKFQKAFERLEDEDPLYPLELSDGCPTTRDWDAAHYFADFLQKFYDATVHLSGSTYVTSNMFFNEVCAIQGFLFEWTKGLESLNDVSISCMARKMQAKFDKYWGKVEKINMLLMIAIVLDPRYKFRYVKFCLSEFYESTIVEGFITKVKAELKRMYDEYQKFNVGSSSSSKTSTDITNEQPFVEGSGKTTSLQSKFRKHLEEVETDGGKSEVDKYLEEQCEKETSNFDILNWWKVNSSKYVILSKVARDVLAIPVSTVASESAFSTGGRVIDQFRSSLTPKLVECLICMQDWFRAIPLPFEVEESMAEMEELELGTIFFMQFFKYCIVLYCFFFFLLSM